MNKLEIQKKYDEISKELGRENSGIPSNKLKELLGIDYDKIKKLFEMDYKTLKLYFGYYSHGENNMNRIEKEIYKNSIIRSLNNEVKRLNRKITEEELENLVILWGQSIREFKINSHTLKRMLPNDYSKYITDESTVDKIEIIKSKTIMEFEINCFDLSPEEISIETYANKSKIKFVIKKLNLKG